ncbi:transmembrane protein [Thalictrum thalictroides]|uniref:Transmembrane protein n=1 Tax=Thalictrum thalictroides TaxID=46969 RepID=A0A7J6W8A9_THATH|nr:transmembrane protein [Thalictrum thalictroides]
MPISAQYLLSSNPRYHLYSHSSPYNILPHSLKPQTLSINISQNISPQYSIRKLESNSSLTHQWQRLRVYESNTIQRELEEEEQQQGGVYKFNLDVLLSIAEVICLIPSAILSIGCIVNWTFVNTQKSIQLNRVFGWQLGLLVGAVLIGGLIRRRQWGRIYKAPLKKGVSKLDLVGRIEKLEEDLRSSTTIIRMLSRQLEKLGIRFRVTRKSLKEPISEAASLALKTSEATQTLQMQKDILEKELGEIQKVLLAMQDQQHKQLDLILAIAKVGKLRENKREYVVEDTTQKVNSVAINKEGKPIDNEMKTGGRQKIVNKDSA